MRHRRGVGGFTIIELLIVVIVIGILAAAGLAKYQNFADTARQRTCLEQQHTIEKSIALWEAKFQRFAENSKVAFGFTVRTGMLTGTAVPNWREGEAPGQGTILDAGLGNAPGPVPNGTGIATLGGPPAFVNERLHGPLSEIARDDKMWVCPGGLTRYYGGEVQNLPNNFMDLDGGGGPGVARDPTTLPVGLTGRYNFVKAGKGNPAIGARGVVYNGGFPPGWISAGPLPTEPDVTLNVVVPQVPFHIALCGLFGTFGGSRGGRNATGLAGESQPDTTSVNGGGPVGPNGSNYLRHTAYW